MNLKPRIKGLWVPLITPFFQGHLDKESLVKLVQTIEADIDGFVPCLSSGEGGKMSDELWNEVVQTVVKHADKPVAAGILNTSMESIVGLSEKAKALGCVAVAVPLQGQNVEEQKDFCKAISDKSALPVVLYNTEKVHIDDVDVLVSIVSECSNIISIKDSSQNKDFFQDMVEASKEDKLTLSVLQGMENQLLESGGCDGYLIALANTDPKLCKNMLSSPSRESNDEILKKWDEYDLASDRWYVGIKEALFNQGVIKSKELIQ